MQHLPDLNSNSNEYKPKWQRSQYFGKKRECACPITDAPVYAHALRKQSKCGMIQEAEGHWPLAKFLEKIAKSEFFFGVAHSTEH